MWSALIATIWWLLHGAPVAHSEPYRPPRACARPSERVTDLPDLAWDDALGVVDAKTGKPLPTECKP